MVTFRQFLLLEDEDEDVIQDWVSIVKKNCSNYLNENKESFEHGIFLFRGAGDDVSTSVKRRTVGPIVPRKDRYPMSTPRERHRVMDNWFDKQFGFKYRSAGLFCHSRWSGARQYGSLVWNIFPANGFKLCSSPIIKDLFEVFEEPDVLVQHDYLQGDTRSINLFRDSTSPGDGFDENEVEKVLKFGKFEEFTELSEIPKVGNEIMVNCPKYYGIQQKQSNVLLDDYLHDIIFHQLLS